MMDIRKIRCTVPCSPMSAENGCHCAEARDEVERLRVENIQMRFALGYPMPADLEKYVLPENPFKCGVCEARATLTSTPAPSMTKGRLILTCGCEYAPAMGDLDSLFRVWTDEVCTRDPDNPFVEAEISGIYCAVCWQKMQETSDD